MTDDERPVLLLTCSGISHTGQLTTMAGQFLRCRYPALLSRHLALTRLKRPLEEELDTDERLVAVDGCDQCCAGNRIALVGRVPDAYLIATREGITKRGMEEPRFDEIEALSRSIAKLARNDR